MRRPRYVALIEDRPEDRFFLGHTLRQVSADCQLVEFACAEDALDYLRTADRPKLDLILVDIAMPRMNGFEFADAYGELYPEFRGNAKVYMLSSSIDPVDRKAALSHPMISGFIEKPLQRELLSDLLR